MNAYDISALVLPAEDAECIGIMTSAFQATLLSEQGILNALKHPIWQKGEHSSLFNRIQPGETCCIVVSDHTRKTAIDRVLPILLHGFSERGCHLEDMFILIASGIHRHPTPAELKIILGKDVMKTFRNRIFFHNPDDENNLVSIGKTHRGHEVYINRLAVEARRLILIGAALYHYHAGFCGGRKSLVPGLAARSTIASNHSLALEQKHNQIHPAATIGILKGNPVAEDMLEGALLHKPDFIVNTVLTPDGSLAGIFAGDLNEAHLAACRLVERIYRINLKQEADFVIASAGSASNWIQSHKALFNAARAIKPNGRIILQAPCSEGLGDERFRYWVKKSTLNDIYSGLRKSLEVLGQTALSTRRHAEQTILISNLSQRDASDLGMRTAPDLDTAIHEVLEHFQKHGIKKPAYYLMPDALYLVPFLPGQS